MSAARQRVIDDTDQDIQYGPGDWLVVDPNSLHVGNFGPVYQGTSHASSSDSILSFPFNGTSISVFGSIIISTVNNITDPTWECYVDQTKIPNGNDKFQFPENNWGLCSQPQLDPGPHVLSIQVKSKGQKFYLDYLTYTPLPNASFETAVLLYPPTDPDIVYGSGWRSFGGETGTNANGAQLFLSFHGTSVVQYGFVPHELSHNATWATYSIDDGNPVNFTLPGLAPTEGTTQYFTSLFRTPTIPSGPHNLVITYGGDDQHTPLMIGGFYVTNTSTGAMLFPSPISISPSISTTTPSPSPSQNPSDSAKHSLHTASVGAIASLVVAGVIVSLLIAIGIVLCQRRRRRKQHTPDPTAATPYPVDEVPRSLAISAGDAGSRKTRPPGSFLPVPQNSWTGKNRVNNSLRPPLGFASSSASGSTASVPIMQQHSHNESSLPEENGARVMQHHDSGVRLSTLALDLRARNDVVHLPPGYSAV
ncbi:peroxidase [Favolaschia claudopus]|uniref:Peroxidase n=1 Tax=Favolaschia claudopus TaxID=2862362 RepID=A0AAW0A7D1_9AGAR